MPFEHQLTVRFHEVDRAGIVYFARVLQYCHEAFEEMLAAIFGSVEPLFASGDWGLPLVHAEADYKRPIRLSDRLTVQLEVERLGTGSLTFAFRLLGADDPDDLRATARLVHAFVELPGFKPRQAPEDLVAGLRRLGLIA